MTCHGQRRQSFFVSVFVLLFLRLACVVQAANSPFYSQGKKLLSSFDQTDQVRGAVMLGY